MMSQQAAEWHGMDQAALQCQDLPGSSAMETGGFPCPPGRQCGTKEPTVSRSCPSVGDRGQPGLNRAECVCPAGHWGDQRGDTPSL